MSTESSAEFSAQAQQAVAELRSMGDMLRWAVSRLSEYDVYFGHGTDNPWDEARVLITHALHLPWKTDPQWLQYRLTTVERQAVIDVLQQRLIERRPTPYITGVAWFCNQPFFVDERVLIPRSPIAELIQQEFSPHLSNPPQRIMDLCSGSGCIGIAAAQVFTAAQVELLDISFDAQVLAEENIQYHQLDDRVMALQSDLFSSAQGHYDLILANPPYVDADDMSCLPLEYQHEPELALASGDDGLLLPNKILQQAADYLTEEGILVLEVGNSWPALQAAHPNMNMQWIDFEQGGHGVAVISATELKRYFGQ